MPTIRPFTTQDDIHQLTALLHRAYKEHSENGLNFRASHQTADVTAERVSQGLCLILEDGKTVLGTITIDEPESSSPIPWYRDPHTYTFGQFAVEPNFRSRGYGRLLHDAMLAYVKSKQGKYIALDTSELAHNLIALYLKWGYEKIGTHRWEMTNYTSVILRREL